MKTCNRSLFDACLNETKSKQGNLKINNDEKKKLTQENLNIFIFKYLIIMCSLPYRLVECEGNFFILTIT